MPLELLIVDDEEPIRMGLQRMLATYCQEVTEVRQAHSVATAITLLATWQPDVVLLDVEMGDGTGIDLLRALGTVDFQVIFITAHHRYAVDAFRLSAVDFLLKPIVPEDLVAALSKAGRNIHLQEQAIALQALQDRMGTPPTGEPRIALRALDAIHLVKQSEILYCMADGVYSLFMLEDGRKLLVSRNLKEYEDLLGNQSFLRVHHSYLANMDKVKGYRKGEGGFLVFGDGVEIPVSQRKRDMVMDFFKRF